MIHLPLAPVWLIDLTGSICMIVLSWLCLRAAYRLFRRDADNALANHLLWFCLAIFAFSASRSLGHILKHILYFTGHTHVWRSISPVSGSINSITFVVIAAVTLFFHRMEIIMGRMKNDRLKIERTTQELVQLNRDAQAMITEKTRAAMALRVAHEIRNPVMVIGGLLQRSADNVPECGGQRDHLDRIMGQARKLEELVGRFENFHSGLEKIITSIDILPVIKEAIDKVRPAAEVKKIRLEFNPSPITMHLQGNRHLLQFALGHVLQNAIEAGRADDTITVRVDMGERGVVTRVTDTGPGIPKEILAHVFEPFYTTTRGKTGLGLAYVQQIIEEHNGTVRIDSEEGKGTTVEIVLPFRLGLLEYRP